MRTSIGKSFAPTPCYSCYLFFVIPSHSEDLSPTTNLTRMAEVCSSIVWSHAILTSALAGTYALSRRLCVHVCCASRCFVRSTPLLVRCRPSSVRTGISRCSSRIRTIAIIRITQASLLQRQPNLIPRPHIGYSPRLPIRILSGPANRNHLTRHPGNVVP